MGKSREDWVIYLDYTTEKFGKRKKSIHSATIVENIDKKILIYRLHSLDTLIGCRYNYIDK